MNRYQLLAVLAIAALMTTQAMAQNDCCCPSCGVKVCKPTVEVTKEKKTVYKVECKEICVPKVRLPWQMCCEPECGMVKKVKVLKKSSIECEKCGYKWNVVDGDPCSPCAPGNIRRPLRGRFGANMSIGDTQTATIQPTQQQIAQPQAQPRIQPKSQQAVPAQKVGSGYLISDQKEKAYYQPKK